jgi:tripartite-type tricarboxylate transporter receptor subunit TctC
MSQSGGGTQLNKTTKIIVTLSARSTSEVLTQFLGLKMPESLYLQVVANNRPSASGNPGTVTGAQHRNGAQYQPYLERFPLLQAKLRQESIT